MGLPQLRFLSYENLPLREYEVIIFQDKVLDALPIDFNEEKPEVATIELNFIVFRGTSCAANQFRKHTRNVQPKSKSNCTSFTSQG